jgi:hypothetical protein
MGRARSVVRGGATTAIMHTGIGKIRLTRNRRPMGACFV